MVKNKPLMGKEHDMHHAISLNGEKGDWHSELSVPDETNA
jgi:hypothetical protein